MKYHFWFSQKSAEQEARRGTTGEWRCRLDDGTEHRYTHCHDENIPNGGAHFGDEIYLGEGSIIQVGSRSMELFQ